MAKIQSIEQKTQNIVQKHNDLVRFMKFKQKELTIVEKKFINYALAQLNKEDLKNATFPEQTFKVKEIGNIMGLKKVDRFYTSLRDLTADVLSKPMEIVKPNFKGEYIVSQINWFSKCDYNFSKGTVTVRFHESLIPYVLKLKGQYTTYRLENTIRAKNKYMMEWYEYFLSWLNIKDSLDLHIDEIREFLQVQNLYKRDYDMIKKCVRVPIAEINEKTDLHIEIEDIIQGNKIIAIKFKYRMKNVEEFLKMKGYEL